MAKTKGHLSEAARKEMSELRKKWWAEVKAGVHPAPQMGRKYVRGVDRHRVLSEEEWLDQNYTLLRSGGTRFPMHFREVPTTFPPHVAKEHAEYLVKRIAALMTVSPDDPDWEKGERESLIALLTTELKVMRKRAESIV